MVFILWYNLFFTWIKLVVFIKYVMNDLGYSYSWYFSDINIVYIFLGIDTEDKSVFVDRVIYMLVI